MKTSVKIAVAALVIASFGFAGCKKGEGDPFLSLKTRKSRVAGEWKVTKGEGTHSYVFGSQTITETMSYDGTTETTVSNPGNFTSTDKHTTTYSFEKDGTFTITETDNNGSTPDVTTTKGNWNFSGGVGEAKNKSQLVLLITDVTTSSGTTSYTGSDRMSMVFDLYELKSKEMIIQDKGTSSSQSSSTDKKWTLEAQ